MIQRKRRKKKKGSNNYLKRCRNKIMAISSSVAEAGRKIGPAGHWCLGSGSVCGCGGQESPGRARRTRTAPGKRLPRGGRGDRTGHLFASLRHAEPRGNTRTNTHKREQTSPLPVPHPWEGVPRPGSQRRALTSWWSSTTHTGRAG